MLTVIKHHLCNARYTFILLLRLTDTKNLNVIEGKAELMASSLKNFCMLYNRKVLQCNICNSL